MTIIPYMTPERDEAVNKLIRKVAESERLRLFDVYSRYAVELTHGRDMLNYRRYPLEKIPERHRDWVNPFVRSGQVVVMDNRLDAHFRDLPGWFGDRHPNLAGYHVIGDETARFLAKLIREKKTTGADVAPGEATKPAETGLEFISIARHRLLEITPIGKTVEGRGLEIVRIGHPDAPHRVFLRARAHAWEPGGDWVVQGLVDRLLKDDDEAKR
jgi:hypothetical protein